MLKNKEHYIYKTTDIDTGHFYIGMHTGYIDDSYLGSGNWIKQHPRPHRLRKEILATTKDKESLRHLERVYLKFNNESKLSKNISRGYIKSDKMYEDKKEQMYDDEFIINRFQSIRDQIKSSIDESNKREEEFWKDYKSKQRIIEHNIKMRRLKDLLRS